MQGYIYLLHFDDPLHHAQHYLGCTTCLSGRLEAHALGSGSRLCRALMNMGLHWKLSALGICSAAQMRRVERSIKNAHNLPRYCPICTPDTTSALPACRMIDLSLVNCPKNSQELRKTAAPVTRSYRVTTPDESLAIRSFILNISVEHKAALGFIPAGGEEGLTTLERNGQIILAFRNETPVGLCAFTINHTSNQIRIQQCAVRSAVQRDGHGTGMVEFLALTYPNHDLLCKVRDDLPANDFWKSIGFEPTGQVIHPTSGSTLNSYFRKRMNHEQV